MAKDRTPVLKRCRSLGLEPSVLGITKKASIRQSGRKKKLSEYGVQLKEKQKVKFIYGVLEKQFRLYYAKAKKKSGIVGENLLQLLEHRLDNVVFRLRFSRTRKEARQNVNQGHFLVNGKKVDIPSYQVKEGDIISLKEGSKKLDHFKVVAENTHYRICPEWLDSDMENWTGKVKRPSSRADIDYPINETLIIELYSK